MEYPTCHLHFLGTKVCVYIKKIQVTCGIFHVIIQQMVTLSKYGHDALNICHP